MVDLDVRAQRTTLALAFLATMLTASIAHADSFTLAWDANPEPDVVGYFVFVGSSPGVYSTPVDVGHSTTYTFSSALPGTTYYVTVAAYVGGPVLGPKAVEVVTTTAGGPTLSNPGNRTSPKGTPLTLALSASDPNNDPLTFSGLGLPTGLLLNPVTGVISGTPSVAGAFNASATVSDPSANVSTHSFTWTIVATDAAAPTIAISSPSSSTSSTPNAFVTVAGTASDDVGVTSVTWANSAGGSGVAAGTANWSVVVPLSVGTNVITMTAKDAANKSSSSGRTVTMTVQTPTVAPSPAPSTLQITAFTANKAAPQLAGTTITFTATATGGTNPYQYKWWLFDGVTWTVKREWSSQSTFAWTPSRANSHYQIRVWARSAGASANAPSNDASTKTLAFPIKSAVKRRR